MTEKLRNLCLHVALPTIFPDFVISSSELTELALTLDAADCHAFLLSLTHEPRCIRSNMICTTALTVLFPSPTPPPLPAATAALAVALAVTHSGSTATLLRALETQLQLIDCSDPLTPRSSPLLPRLTLLLNAAIARCDPGTAEEAATLVATGGAGWAPAQRGLATRVVAAGVASTATAERAHATELVGRLAATGPTVAARMIPVLHTAAVLDVPAVAAKAGAAIHDTALLYSLDAAVDVVQTPAAQIYPLPADAAALAAERLVSLAVDLLTATKFTFADDTITIASLPTPDFVDRWEALAGSPAAVAGVTLLALRALAPAETWVGAAGEGTAAAAPATALLAVGLAVMRVVLDGKRPKEFRGILSATNITAALGAVRRNWDEAIDVREKVVEELLVCTE